MCPRVGLGADPIRQADIPKADLCDEVRKVDASCSAWSVQSSEGAISGTHLEVDLKQVDAAPGLVVDEFPLASPELALVDADLAAELRRSLGGASVQREFADELRPEQAGDAQHFRVSEKSAEVSERTPTHSERPSSHYPLLPPLEPDERAIEETEAALRRIRERPTDEWLAQRLEVDIEF